LSRNNNNFINKDNTDISNFRLLGSSKSQSQSVSIPISINNADLSKSSNPLINSPRTIEACQNLGIELRQLYKLTFEEFKLKNPEMVNLSPKILKFHYEGREKIRIKTIKEVKEERNKIIKEEERIKSSKNFEIKFKNSKSLENKDIDKKIMEEIEKGKKEDRITKKKAKIKHRSINGKRNKSRFSYQRNFGRYMSKMRYKK
jgi:hypothetical protein